MTSHRSHPIRVPLYHRCHLFTRGTNHHFPLSLLLFDLSKYLECLPAFFWPRLVEAVKVKTALTCMNIMCLKVCVFHHSKQKFATRLHVPETKPNNPQTNYQPLQADDLYSRKFLKDCEYLTFVRPNGYN